MWVAKESRLPTQIEMLDGSGDLVKVAEQESKNIGGYWVLSKITMTDKKKNSRTVLEMTDIKVDQNLDDEIFTRRFLQRRLR
jgi:outer membrane lipoprotein-sorting protein